VRLFVAVEIGEMLAGGAAQLSEELERRATAAARRAKVTWIPADRMHLTIRFIGEVDDGRASMVRAALEQPLAVAPFNLTLCGAGTFPKSGIPRVVWLGVTEGREQLLSVEREITARLTPLGIPEEDRAYSPHLTLARVRDPSGLKSTRLLDGLTARLIGTTRIETITLFHSKLSPKGPTYTPLLRTPLEGAGGSKDRGGSKDPPSTDGKQ
jgi:RNA 2',3'-cyclic 3'-phosphodiesterase